MKSIGALWPGNSLIDEWLNAYDNGTANVPTKEQIEIAHKARESKRFFLGLWQPEPTIRVDLRFQSQHTGAVLPQAVDGPRLQSARLSTLDRVRSRKTWTPPQAVPSTICGRPKRWSQRTVPPSMTPNLITVNLDAAPVAPDSQVTKDVSTQAQQDVQSITGAVTEAPANAAAVPNDEDPKAGQTLATDTTRDGNMAVLGKVGGNGTKSRGGLGGALRSAGDQISSSISEVTGGLTGGTKTGEDRAPAAGKGPIRQHR